MKKLFIFGVALMISISLGSSFTAKASDNVVKKEIGDPQISISEVNVLGDEFNNNLLHSKTDQVNIANFEVTKSTFKLNNENEDEKSYTAGYEILIPIEVEEDTSGGFTPMNIDGQTRIVGEVTAKLNVHYDVSSDGKQIRVNRVYGSWIPQYSPYLFDIRNRFVGVHAGWAQPKLERYPTSNEFSYYTNWGYGPRILGGTFSARAWSEATVNVHGRTYKIEIMFPFQ